MTEKISRGKLSAFFRLFNSHHLAICLRRSMDRPDKKKTNRLHGMLVHEISLVDRPANKRRFLLWKRSDQMPHPEELIPDGKGGFVEKSELPSDDDVAKGKKADKADDKDMKKVACPKCGADNPAGTDKCVKCGAPLSKAPFPPPKPGDEKPGDKKPGDEDDADGDKKPPFLKKGSVSMPKAASSGKRRLL